MEEFLKKEIYWIRKPQNVEIKDGKVEVYTEPGTDLWQRTYYGFQNDNAPVLQAKTAEKYFSFVVRTQFESKHRFDQRSEERRVGKECRSGRWAKEEKKR